MKTLKFKPHLAEMIRTGKKVSTWRLFDDKDLQEGDMIGLCENGIEEPFATAKITKVVEKELGSLTDEDWVGHERFASDKEMYETYRKYYGPTVGSHTTVKILWFDKDQQDASELEQKPKRDMLNVPYDPAWPQVFEALKSVISHQLGDLAASIEHVGSTAIPGLAAKPRIDLDVVIESSEKLGEVAESLGKLGYFRQGELGRAGREAFGRTDDMVPYDDKQAVWMKHNLYVCPKDSPVLREHLLFRNYLREHPDVAAEYSNLKQSLVEADRYNQDAYVIGKTTFVQGVLKKAQE